MINPEDPTEGGKRDTAQEKERHRTEVNDEILPEDAGGAAPQQQPGEFHQGPADAQVTSFVAIPRRDGHVLEHGLNSSEGN